jgi:hypothetical protein
MTAHLNAAPQPVRDPSALLNSPGLAVVYLTDAGSYLAFTQAADARGVAAACTRAAELLEGPQVAEA